MSGPVPYGPWLPLQEIGRGGMGVVYRIRRIGLGDLAGAQSDLALAEREAELVGSVPDRLECLAERVHLTLPPDTPLGEIREGLQLALMDRGEGRALLHGQSVRSLTEAQRRRAIDEGELTEAAPHTPGADPQPR
ncbi:MAG TPA: hypothetical protein ENK18_20475 [Deltaproteobacteria bacterium]|nr:hypothetical protein [Deltaproteobacteria bacterium]